MPPQSRSGFTLVETIVALVLLQIAMLALAATAGVAARDLSDTLMRRRAYAIAESRAEWLRATACTSTGAGSRALGAGAFEFWTVLAVGTARVVTDSVSAPLTRGARVAAVSRAWVLCGG